MSQARFIGLMSGTSMDGVDAVLASFDAEGMPRVEGFVSTAFDPPLREALFSLQQPGTNEIEREARATQMLVRVYARSVQQLLQETDCQASDITAVGVHGQTIRHRPEWGFTRQSNHPALLAELCGIDVIADFRSRDVAAGGQGAPLVPAFHAQVFGAPGTLRVICNIGGISNVSILRGQDDVTGFDCGPGNALMDAWAERRLGQPYDDGGRFAASGSIQTSLLQQLLQEPWLSLPPPKSTGRDLFNPEWLEQQLIRADPAQTLTPADVQATLTAFTAQVIANDIARCAGQCQRLYICGGGARNPVLIQMLQTALQGAGMHGVSIAPTQALGIDAQYVEALAFAWLALRFTARLPGNLPAVTGAAGPRVLGALYPK